MGDFNDEVFSSRVWNTQIHHFTGQPHDFTPPVLMNQVNSCVKSQELHKSEFDASSNVLYRELTLSHTCQDII